MDIFCENCQKNVGKIADEKIPVGKKVNIGCPKCGEKIYFARAVNMSGATASPQPPDPAQDIGLGGTEVVESTAEGRHDRQTKLPRADASSFEIAGNPQFPVIDNIIREAWHRISGTKLSIWLSIIVYFVVVFLVNFLLELLVGLLDINILSPFVIALRFIVSLSIIPLYIGVIMLGIRRSVGISLSYKDIFGYYGNFTSIILASILMSLLIIVGLLLLVIPGLYLMIAYSMTLPLIADKNLGPWEAMETSRKNINRCFFTLISIYNIIPLILIVSILPLFVGLIWTVPMVLIINGIMYREIFGVSVKA